jgi:hypothetical protein
MLSLSKHGVGFFNRLLTRLTKKVEFDMAHGMVALEDSTGNDAGSATLRERQAVSPGQRPGRRGRRS